MSDNGSGKPSGPFDRDRESIRPVRTRRDDPGAMHGGDSVRGAPWNFRHALLVARIPPRLPAHE
jgi:hypothetical protein